MHKILMKNSKEEEPVALYRLYVRRGAFVCTDPQRRCYYGYMEGYVEWGEWEPWFKDTLVDLEYAKDTVRLFSREAGPGDSGQELKYEPVEESP
jgi:hypothetical protein